MIPEWLHLISIAFLGLGALSAAVIVLDLVRHPQHMWIMNIVWPVTALFGTVWILWQYFNYGRRAEHRRVQAAKTQNKKAPGKRNTPFPIIVANGTLHCGAGCTLGDILAEWLIFAFPAIALAFGWQSIFSEKIFAVWIVDYIFAYLFGIAFQYFTIAPMRGLSLGRGLVEAIKADTVSITAWQAGMYGFMAFAYFVIFRKLIGTRLETNSVEFWFMMQISMIFGFITSYPANWWLLRSGIKEPM